MGKPVLNEGASLALALTTADRAAFVATDGAVGIGAIVAGAVDAPLAIGWVRPGAGAGGAAEEAAVIQPADELEDGQQEDGQGNKAMASVTNVFPKSKGRLSSGKDPYRRLSSPCCFCRYVPRQGRYKGLQAGDLREFSVVSSFNGGPWRKKR
jgi:hypothetical protein